MLAASVAAAMTEARLVEGRPLDWSTSVWEAFAVVERRLSEASEAMQKIRDLQRRKHVRANRYEAAYDDLWAAEREWVAVQRALGLAGDDPLESDKVAAALAKSAAVAAGWLLLLGARLGLPSGPWLLVLRGLLPVGSLGFAAAPGGGADPMADLRLTLVQFEWKPEVERATKRPARLFPFIAKQ